MELHTQAMLAEKRSPLQLSLTGLLKRGSVRRCEGEPLKPCLIKLSGLAVLHKPTQNICYLRLIWKGCVFCFTVSVKIDDCSRLG